MTSGLRFVFGSDIDGPDWENAVKGCGWRFVRGGSQLALYEESRKPTGHVMTAWEAWTAYGRDIIDEAIEYGSAVLIETKGVIESCLSHRREELGISSQALARSVGMREQDVLSAETSAKRVPIRTLQKLTFGLGMDERLLSFRSDCGADPALTRKLRGLQSYGGGASVRISQEDAASLAEAASVTRVHTRLRGWLGSPDSSTGFTPSDDFGNESGPEPGPEARRVGYNLAELLRERLDLGVRPVESMRDLLAERLGVTVVWAELSPEVAGATFSSADHEGNRFRGVALNSIGENEDVWTRRVTLARELGHALLDPDNRLRNLLVHGRLPEEPPSAVPVDPVDQRADAFALAFLAPKDEVERLAPLPVDEFKVGRVMQHFGMCEAAARRRIVSCYFGDAELPPVGSYVAYRPDRADLESLVTGNSMACSARYSRQGRFAHSVRECFEQGLISEDSAAFYMDCTPAEMVEAWSKAG